MRILIITPIYFPQKGGASEDFKGIVNVLKTSGNITITILTSVMKRQLLKKTGNITIKRFLNDKNSLIENSIYNRDKILREIKEKEYDVLVIHSNITFLRYGYEEILNSFEGVKILLKTDLVPIPSYEGFDYVVSISKGIREFLKKENCPDGKIVDLPIFFTPPKLPKNSKRPLKEKYIFFPGGGNQLKGAYELFKAFRLLKEDGSDDLKLVVAGNSSGFEDFHKNIIFTGPINRSKYLNYLYHSELMVLPSYSEGIPRTILEAISFKKPVLCTKNLTPEFEFFNGCQFIKKIEASEIKDKILMILNRKCRLSFKPICEIISSPNPLKEWSGFFGGIIKIRKTFPRKVSLKKSSLTIIEKFFNSRSYAELKNNFEKIFYTKKFWGNEKSDLLLEFLKISKEKFQTLPFKKELINYVDSLKFLNSKLFVMIGEIYYSLNYKREAKYFYKKALTFYSQNSRLLAVYRLLKNFKLTLKEKNALRKTTFEIIMNSDENRLLDFIIMRGMFSIGDSLEIDTISDTKILAHIKYLLSNYAFTITKNYRKELLRGIFEWLFYLKPQDSFYYEKLASFFKVVGQKEKEDFFKLYILNRDYLNDYEKALFWLKKYEKKCKDFSSSFYDLGILFYQKFDYKKAEKYFLLSLGEENLDKERKIKAEFYLGEIYRKLGLCEKSSYHYENALKWLKEEKDNMHLLYTKALVYKKIKKLKLAEKFFKNLVKKGIQDRNLLLEVYFSIIDIEYQLEDNKNLKKYAYHYLKLLKSRKQTKSDFYKIALVYRFLGRGEEAKEWFLKVIENEKDIIKLEKSFFYLGEIFYKEGEIEKAYDFYKKAIDIIVRKKDKTCDDYYLISSTLKRIKEYIDAKRWFKMLIKECKQKELLSGAYFHLGEIELLQKNKGKAIEYFEKCLEFNPEHNKAKEYVKSL